jgi:hypothetical protein
MKSLILQKLDGHYECLGIGVQYILDNSPTCDGIDIYFGMTPTAMKHSWRKDWFDAISKVYPTVKFTLLKKFEDKEYDFFFCLTGSDYAPYYSKWFESFAIKPLHKACIAHRDNQIVADFTNLTLTPSIPCELVKLPKYREALMSFFPNNFLPTVPFFTVGNLNRMDLPSIQTTLAKVDKTMILCYQDVPRNLTHLNKLIPKNRISVPDLIKCFLYKKGIMCTKPGSVYESEICSGIIHLAISFDTTLFIPTNVGKLYTHAHTFTLFDDYKHLESLLS